MTTYMKPTIHNDTMMDYIFDSVEQGRPVSSLMVAKAVLELHGGQERYFKIESWIISRGYDKKMSELKVTYVKKNGNKTGGVSQ